ncbi:MAG: hypothetical protein O2807_02355 [bacterium]|nr:hypothetical protein [bacterium]
MELKRLLVVAIAGFLATYAHLLFALIGDRFGLAKLDFARGLGGLFFGGSYGLGLAAVHLNGIVFALVYAGLIGPLLPGALVVRGLVYGGLLFIFSQCFFNPAITGHGFFSRKLHPRAWMTALIAHGIYGGLLGWISPVIG